VRWEKSGDLINPRYFRVCSPCSLTGTMRKVGDQSHKNTKGSQGQGQGLLWTDAFKDVGSEEECMNYRNLCELQNNEIV